MNLLYSNDQSGQYPDSWYAATADIKAPRTALKGQETADVCVIGAGYTGLSAALHMAEAGLKVIVLEAHRAGFGASGRNGGQLGSGQRQDQRKLEKMMGPDHARHLWDLGEDAKALVKSLIAQHQIDCYLKPGVAWTGSTQAEAEELQSYARHLQTDYGYDQIHPLNAEECHAMCPSPDYVGGLIDRGAAHLHPLRFALGLADAAERAGAVLHEQSQVLDIERGAKVTVQTVDGSVVADHVVLAGNGYLGKLDHRVPKRVMPINNFIVATEPLGDDAARVLTEDVAVADSKFVVNYFRLSHDNRLLFGGGESYGYRFPRNIAAVVRKPMTKVYPHLRDVRIDYAWGGTLAITMTRMPNLARLDRNILTASGYSGHGLGTAVHAGQLMALAIEGQAAGFDAMAAVPTPRFPGGTAFRSPLLALAMTWFSLRDRLGV
ncbi:NAD(P)/FAD-dependent oxidoreductase [Pseudoprimorskyibacter insulae]|uniref:Gamma-glutamylputrescine oxidoreductase n=1 Tax=Pseudoprimorskyibacter insulae TaxID=1695997 RepID=A0A2R8AYD1_9RHOB|nr:FAD-binding oxidoreductase [Pseudoprimorskyibacter insulae]SPF81036.1 Gamma-glutamylputrescine oxidoreductase [Pseudoprimorskyibacter insulae]